MSKYIDLSYTIEAELSVHPFDNEVKLYQDKFLDVDGYNNSRLESGMHAGTHIDLPGHLLRSPTLFDELPLDRFIGNGCLLNVSGEDVIPMKEEYLQLVKKNDIVLLYTGFDRQFGRKTYFAQHPVVSIELAAFLINAEVKLIGMDLPAPDKYPFKVHKMFFKRGIFIIENMTNLDRLIDVGDFEVIAFPLKVRAEASPVRVVAKV